MGRLTEAERKRRQRERAKRGSKAIRVEIMDWEAWSEILSADGLLMGSVVNERVIGEATGAFIWKLCRDHQQQTAERQLADIQPSVTGLIDRETDPHDEFGAYSSVKTFRNPSRSIPN